MTRRGLALLAPVLLAACATRPRHVVTRPPARRPVTTSATSTPATPTQSETQVQKAATTSAALQGPATAGSSVPLLGFRPMRGQSTTAPGGI